MGEDNVIHSLLTLGNFTLLNHLVTLSSLSSYHNRGTLADEPLLKCKGVSKRFGAVQVLTDVDFEVRAGEVMALVGDNGAGKSTLIKGIAGIYEFDGGQIYFAGKPVTHSQPA